MSEDRKTEIMRGLWLADVDGVVDNKYAPVAPIKKDAAGINEHWHDSSHFHVHERGDDPHSHSRHNGKTYFKNERRSDGMPVKCEGHPSVDMDINDEWCYAG